MVTLTFTSDPESGQVQAQKGQILKFIFLLLSCPVLFQDSKNDICFAAQLYEIPKTAFRKMTSAHLPGFSSIAQPKIKTLARNFEHLLLVSSSIMPICSGFWIS